MSKQFQKKRILLLSIAHFFHDVYPAFFAPILPLLMTKLSLSLTAASLLDVARRIPSLLTLFIGLLADKKPLKYFIILTPAITGISMSFIGIVSDFYSIFALLFIAGLSSICFHIPAPVLVKNFSGKTLKKGMSYFMSAGAIAGTVGTFGITLTITYLGLNYTYILMYFGIGMSIVLYFKLKDISSVHISKKKQDEIIRFSESRKAFIPFFIFLGLFMLFCAGMKLSLTLYLPVYMTTNGASVFFSGISLSALHFAGAIGMIVIGKYSDKFSTKKMIFYLVILSVILMHGMIFFQNNSIIMLIFVIALGFVLFAMAPMILALVQYHNSSRPAFVNSIYFTIGFIINTTIVLLLGYCGDKLGLENTFKICAYLPLFSLPFLYFISENLNKSK
jgi:FSR family fosmidomycin resistance protein-like MFS transporter